jgi:tripartite-type tricarboxylate transporter receptor subunit TctC
MKSLAFRYAAALALAVPFAAGAQSAADYPTKPIHIVVPYSAGGVVDSIARVVGERLAKKYGQAVVIDDKPGAGGSIGNDIVARAAPDGYTLLCVSPGLAVLPSLQKGVTWSTSSFRAVEGLGLISNVWVVPASSPVKTMAELIELARKKSAAGAPLTYATAGIGTSNHLSGELLAQMTNIKLTQVPYKGQPDALTDLLAGRVDSMPLTAALAQAHVKSGQLRALAATTAQRSSAFPDLPTVAQAIDLPDYAVSTWFGFVAPAGTPDAIVDKLSRDIAQIIAEPESNRKLAALGMEVVPQNATQFNTYLAAESARWSKVIKQAGIEPQ